ncbi:diguanylate cyclase/phosphodiesterase with PAS/PAC sensor(s) [Halothece sp. PCC 7418]|uniref:sensor domain-containing protein n=1 Tax=Halothece sp. (strain PCC 7418) TaxID=65093 RepID=UPI0002A08854|nr:EAL domain-containing protein [Halothece sp. PCC 7418]AFZ42559.1 diguanylate cyclase/phosphodiesterase with PAS/PAC sensor(s) [Halothece sp. PCC 7418]
MSLKKSPPLSLAPIILVINRKGNCRIIQSPNQVKDFFVGESCSLSVMDWLTQDNLETIQIQMTTVLTEQTPKPVSASFLVQGESQPYFGYLFPLSLASVLFIAQPVEQFAGEFTQEAIELFPLSVLLYDAETLQIKAVNQSAIAQYGYSEAEFLQMQLSQLYPSSQTPTRLQNVSDLVTGEWQNCRKDKKLIYVKLTAYPIRTANTNTVLLLAQDITEYCYTKIALHHYTKIALKEKQHSEIEFTPHFPPCGILGFNREWNYTLAVGNALSQITQITMSEGEQSIEGKKISQVFSPYIRELFAPLQEHILLGYPQSYSFQYHQYTYYLQGYPLRNQKEQIIGGFLMIKNQTLSKQFEALLDRHAFYDLTTHLPNQIWFLEQLSRHIKTFSKEGVAVFLLRLERYRIIKYGLGHKFANQLMVAVAKRLKQTLQLKSDFARVGDAALAMFFPQLTQQEKLEQIAQLIHTQLSSAIEIEGEELFCPVSIGVAIYEDSLKNNEFFQDPSALLHAADTAMNAARGEAMSPCVIFHPQLRYSAATRVQLETELRRALRLKQLDVFYQPTVTLAEGKLTGFEALVRWQHPQQGLVSPSHFIPLAQELGLIGFIDWWVLAEACEKLAIWQEMIPQGETLSMNVNLSENMINQVGILERLEQIIQRTGIRPECLKLEVTEGIILEGKTATTGILKQLQAMGVLLSIDDFGTGYSSLQRLHQLPINTLKIDRSFTKRMLNYPEIKQIIKTIINLAHDLNMEVIAEGIEKEEEWEALKFLNCEYGQGFLFGKPRPEADIRDLILAHQSDLILR